MDRKNKGLEQIERMQQLCDEIRVKRAEAQAEAAALISQAEEADKIAEEAAGNGLLDEYLAEKQKSERLKAIAHVKQASAAKMVGTAAEEEISQAWGLYAKEANDRLHEKLSAYIEARADLYGMFTDMMKDLETSYRLRRQCGELCDLNVNNEYDRQKMRDLFPFDLPQHNKVGADQEFFVKTDLSNREINVRYNLILNDADQFL